VSQFHQILGQSVAAHEIGRFGQRAATVDAPVLLTGESGTGKGLLARAIHNHSRRAAKPLVAVNCAGIPESLFESEFFGHSRGAFTGAHESRRGLFEQAHGGTLFLDEIGELPLPLQAKLLTALEDGEIRRLGAERTSLVDVRLIAATGVNLEESVRRGHFRRDLYHRLLVLSFRLPPLRQRTGDIEFLAQHFLDLFSRKYQRPVLGFEPGAATRLMTYPWPGNVRELAHAIEAAILACDQPRIRIQHLPHTILAPTAITTATTAAHTIAAMAMTPQPAGAQSAATNSTSTLPPAGRYSFYGDPDDERRHIQDALRRYHGNKTRAAAALGMARNTLRLKIRALGLDREHAGR
jgi:two-component system response regulator AtoC